MKNFLLFIFIVFSLSLSAAQSTASIKEQEEIGFKGQTQDDHIRSVFPVQGWHIGAEVYVSFMNCPAEVVISIKDQSGKLVAEKVLTSPELAQISLAGDAGTYTIEVRYAGSYLYGTFTL